MQGMKDTSRVEVEYSSTKNPEHFTKRFTDWFDFADFLKEFEQPGIGVIVHRWTYARVLYNVVAEGWTNGTYCLAFPVPTRKEAESWASHYKSSYEGKPYPNGKGFYPCKNFRVVEVIDG